jgi:hypothetical protein
MKKILEIFIVGLGIILLPACANKNLEKSLLESREEGHDCFVQTKDRYYDTKKIKDIQVGFSIVKFKLSDGTKIKIEDVIAYQTKEAYYKRMSNRPPDHFAKRVIKGRINFYTIYVSGGRAGYTTDKSTGVRSQRMSDDLERYVQKDNGNIYGLDYKTLRELVSDYPPTLAHLEQYSKVKGSDKKMDLMWAVMNEYNEAMKTAPVK